MASNPVIERYIADVSIRLPGPRRWRAGVLDELRDSLLDATDALCETTTPAAAAVRAVAEHGPVDQVSRAYEPELATVWARRAGLLALGIIPAMAIVWNVALHLGPATPWHPSHTALHIAAPLIAGGVCSTVACSSAALLGTGRLTTIISNRLLPIRVAICAASVAVSVAVLALLSVVTARAVAAPNSLEWPAVLIALALSLTALAALGRTTYRCVTSSNAVSSHLVTW